jgi:ORF6N domain-containing protein
VRATSEFQFDGVFPARFLPSFLGYSAPEISDNSTEEMKLALKPENIAQLVFFIRGEKVMLDADLAKLYGVSTKALNQALRRNRERFPEDFVFQLTAEEFAFLRSQSVTSNAEEPHSQGLRPNWSQFVTSSRKHRGVRYRPYAFTEQGVAMLSSVLRSRRAVEVNIAIMRTFVQLRRLMDTNRDLAHKIEALEKKYDEQFAEVFAAIKELIAPPAPLKKQIGFHPS